MNNWSSFDSQYQVPDSTGSYSLFDASPSSWNPDWGKTFDWAVGAGGKLWDAATSQVGMSAIGAGISGYMQGEQLKDKTKIDLDYYRQKMDLDRELTMAQIASQENIARMKIEAEERRRKEHNDSFAKPFTGAKKYTMATKPGILG